MDISEFLSLPGHRLCGAILGADYISPVVMEERYGLIYSAEEIQSLAEALPSERLLCGMKFYGMSLQTSPPKNVSFGEMFPADKWDFAYRHFGRLGPLQYVGNGHPQQRDWLRGESPSWSFVGAEEVFSLFEDEIPRVGQWYSSQRDDTFKYHQLVFGNNIRILEAMFAALVYSDFCQSGVAKVTYKFGTPHELNSGGLKVDFVHCSHIEPDQIHDMRQYGKTLLLNVIARR